MFKHLCEYCCVLLCAVLGFMTSVIILELGCTFMFNQRLYETIENNYRTTSCYGVGWATAYMIVSTLFGLLCGFFVADTSKK